MLDIVAFMEQANSYLQLLRSFVSPNGVRKTQVSDNKTEKEIAGIFHQIVRVIKTDLANRAFLKN